MNKIFGIHSFIIVIIIYFLTAIVILFNNLMFKFIYLILIPISFIFFALFYYTKCKCRLTNCGHYFLGQLIRILLEKKSSNYNMLDIIGALSPIFIFNISYCRIKCFYNILVFSYNNFYFEGLGGFYSKRK